MREPAKFGLVTFGFIGGLLAAFAAPAAAANCDCYWTRDCPDPKKQNCNYQSKCTRHCELKVDEWNPDWGAPPVSKPDCDNWIGPCHDAKPQPPNGDDGDNENCEPPTATNPGGGDDLEFKIRDGKCTAKPTKTNSSDAEGQVSNETNQLVSLANAGGGSVVLSGPDPYIDDIMINLAQFALGQYDLLSWPGGGAPPLMADVRSTCGPEALQVLGNALEAEIAEVAASLAQGIIPDAPLVARERLNDLSIECQAWVERRPHDCQYPHPPEHHHEFPFPDGLTCIAEEIAGAARSLNLEGAVAVETPQQPTQ